MEIRPNAKKINKILADLLENTLISSYLITLLNKNSSKLSTALLPGKHQLHTPAMPTRW
jgi:hypothetical protein